MNIRREARQLSPGDQFQVSLTVQLELSELERHDDGRITLNARIVPCGPKCGDGCNCESHVFKESTGPFAFQLKGTQRVPYFGNLQQLLADSERIKEQIARMTSAEGEITSLEAPLVFQQNSIGRE